MLSISRRRISRFITVSACLIFVVWGYLDYSDGIAPYNQVAGFLLALAALIGSSRVSEKPVFQPSEKEMAARDAHNRQAMLNRVRDFWVKGVLESSLHEEARIELGLEEQRDAVAERPWDVILRTPDRPDCVLPPGTKIADVFERVARSLLIIGEPGSGKTTTLLELAREMIDRAEKDPSEKIPVVFNLSSWTDTAQTIADWLVEELRAKYNIPKKIAAPWVKNHSLLLLLDGLDDVALERRAACVEAINGFLDGHLVPVVVCCRKEKYEALDSKLKLQSTVLLQPLTAEQIDGYLERLSPDLGSLREVLRSDRELQKFAEMPLILSIVTLAYQGIQPESLPSLGSTEERRRHLFKTYVDQMFECTTRIDPKLYPKEKTIYWLSWLARKMSEHSQTVFLIERMQPSWLETKAQKQQYSTLIKRVVRLTFVFIFVFIFGLIFGPKVGLLFGLFVGAIGGMLGGVMVGLCDAKEISIACNQGIEQSTKNDLAVCLVCMLISGLFFWLFVDQLITGLFFGLSFGLMCVLIFGLIYWLSAAELEIIIVPYHDIQKSAINALLICLTSVLIGVLIGMLIGGIFIGLFNGLFMGLLFGLYFGGCAVVQHFTLRFVIRLKDFLPWKLVPFLDYATERIFLRKVGGGYVFVHRMLMEYFASLEPGPVDR